MSLQIVFSWPVCIISLNPASLPLVNPICRGSGGGVAGNIKAMQQQHQYKDIVYAA